MATNTKKADVTVTQNEATEVSATTKKKISAKDVDMTQFVVVRNGFQGRLIYKSPRTGERFIWDEFGAEQEMELRELRNARNSAKKFLSTTGLCSTKTGLSTS